MWDKGREKMLYKLAFTIFLTSLWLVHADITNPVLSLQQTTHYPAGTVIYKWEADVNGDGRKEVFLDMDSDYNYHDKNNDVNVPSWYVYLPARNNKAYIQSRGVVFTEKGNYIIPSAPAIDLNKMYIGKISQLGENGIVTIQEASGYRSGFDEISPKSIIYAYTIHGHHFDCDILAQYNPDKGTNRIYNQYLTPPKRTKVKLQTITL